MIKKCFFLFFFILLVLPVAQFGHHYHFKTYSLEEGLPHSQVLSILQDRQGYLWCGTYGMGVSRFDGNSFMTLTQKDGLSDNVVYTIHEDRDGNLWFGTNRGVNKYDKRNFKVYTTKDGLAHNVVRAICEEDEGHFWFATEGGGISHFDGQTFTNYTEREGLAYNVVRSMCWTRNGDLWLGTLRGASRFDGNKFTNYSVSDGLIDNRIYSITQDLNGRLWLGTSKGVSRFKSKTFTNYTAADGLTDNIIHYIFEDRHGILWFGTEKGGVSKYDGRGFTNYSVEDGMPNNYVHSILQDFEGNMWMATDRGICRFRGECFTFLTRVDGLKSNTIWSFWQDPSGVMWIATEDGIARYYEEDDSIVVSKETGIESGTAYSFFEDSRGGLWFGSGGSIFRYNGRKYVNLTKRYNLKNYEIYAVFEDNRGNMWFGTSSSGVMKFDGVRFQNMTTDNGLIHNKVNAIGGDGWGRLYFGTDGGISIYDEKSFVNITTEQGLRSRYVMSILKDSEGNMWIGFYGGGVSKYKSLKNGEVLHLDSFTADDGLGGDEVLLMIFDGDGNLIVGTHNGISKLDIAAYNNSGKKIIKQYDKHSGFVGIECNQNAAYLDRHGNVWFGTIGGVVIYDPGQEKFNPFEPRTYVKNVKLFSGNENWTPYCREIDKDSTLPVDLVLPHAKNHLTFEFVGINLTVPENVKYRFILEGFDRNWSPLATETFVTYSNLPAGNYTFKVAACNEEGVWNVEPTAFSFTIIPPFWQKWWFYLAIIFIGLSLFSTLVKLRTQKLDKQQRILKEKLNEQLRLLEHERKKYEKINLELEQRVEERTERLENVNKQLVQAHRMEAIGTLAEGVAHDLNNILAGIINYPELLLEKIPEDDPFHEFLEKIKKSGEKAAAIVEDLQILSGSGDSRRDDVVDLNNMITEYLHSSEYDRLKFYHPDVDIEIELEDDLGNILGSYSHLYNVVKNLISNGAEASPDGGKINITTHHKRLESARKGSGTVMEGDFIVLSVSDSGQPLSADERERIFEPFFTKKVLGRSGTGLGMAVVWGTVKDHKGFVDVRSKRGEGTTVSLYFPKTSLKVFKDKLVPQIADLKGSGESILVVDDVREQREIATLILSKLGYDVTAVSSGEEAIEFVKANEMDLVLLDMIMDPGMDGCETFKNILKYRPNQKVIIASGFSESDRVNQARRLGAGAFIKKPYLLKEIALAIKTELRK